MSDTFSMGGFVRPAEPEPVVPTKPKPLDVRAGMIWLEGRTPWDRDPSTTRPAWTSPAAIARVSNRTDMRDCVAWIELHGGGFLWLADVTAEEVLDAMDRARTG